MPFDQVMKKFKEHKLHSGSKDGPKVKSRKQATAILLSEKKEAGEGKSEYKPKKKKGQVNTGPSEKFMSRFGKS